MSDEQQNCLAAILLPFYVAYLEWYFLSTFGILGGYFFVLVAWLRSSIWEAEETFQTATIMIGGLAVALSLFTRSLFPGMILFVLAGSGVLSINLSTRLWRGY